jgi:hypothetical protein
LLQVIDSLIERLEGDEVSIFEFALDVDHSPMFSLIHHKEDCEKSFVGAPLLEASFHCSPRLSELVEDNITTSTPVNAMQRSTRISLQWTSS